MLELWQEICGIIYDPKTTLKVKGKIYYSTYVLLIRFPLKLCYVNFFSRCILNLKNKI